MLRIPQEIFKKIKNRLIARQKEIEKNLKTMEASDPVNGDGLAESSEPGTDSWLADAHGRTQAAKQNLINILQNTKQALLNLKKGSYGKCKKCGKQIEIARLEAIPTAVVCLSCSKKPSE